MLPVRLVGTDMAHLDCILLYSRPHPRAVSTAGRGRLCGPTIVVLAGQHEHPPVCPRSAARTTPATHVPAVGRTVAGCVDQPQAQPIGRMAKPEEIAALALYLCSDDASYITGQSFNIDGGYLNLRN